MPRAGVSTSRTADASPWLRQLFAAVDAKDTQHFVGFLAEDATFRFGNQPAVRGRAAIGARTFSSTHSP
jgi:ketosteroid isomerase-like protein